MRRLSKLRYVVILLLMGKVSCMCGCSYNNVSAVTWPIVALLHKSFYFTNASTMVGGAAAAAASFGFVAARKAARKAGVPFPLSGLAEDALVAGGFWAAQRAIG